MSGLPIGETMNHDSYVPIPGENSKPVFPRARQFQDCLLLFQSSFCSALSPSRGKCETVTALAPAPLSLPLSFQSVQYSR